MSSSFVLVSVAVVPFTGVLVRYRAAYYPKHLPDSSDGLVPGTATAPTFVGIWKRVWGIERWGGLYKGIMPTLLFNVILPALWPYRQHPSVYMSPAPATLERSLTSTLISALYTIFGVILTYRSITTSHKLQSFHPKQSLDALITPCERRKPWVLLTPGLLPALLTGILLRVLVLRPLFGLVRLDKPVDGITVELMAYMVVKISLMSLSTVVLAPLDVIVTRLVLQRNYSDGVDISATAPEGELPAADVVDSVGAEVDIEKAAAKDEEFILEDSGAEPAIRYRSDKEVYTGLINCVQTISREEGWGVLYRMWWLTLLGTWVV